MFEGVNNLRASQKKHFGVEANHFDSERRQRQAASTSIKADLSSFPECNNHHLSTQKPLLNIRRGFTLVELLMGLLVSSIIFAAIGTLAMAASSAHEQTKAIGEKQAYIRYTSDRIRDELRQSVKMWYVTNTVVLWRGDENEDNQINGSELIYIEKNVDGDVLQILEFPGNSRSVTAAMIEDGSARGDIIANGTSRILTLLSGCSNVAFTIPGNKRLLNISFDLGEDGNVTSYDICGSFVGSSDNIFDASGALKAGDDD